MRQVVRLPCLKTQIGSPFDRGAYEGNKAANFVPYTNPHPHHDFDFYSCNPYNLFEWCHSLSGSSSHANVPYSCSPRALSRTVRTAARTFAFVAFERLLWCCGARFRFCALLGGWGLHWGGRPVPYYTNTHHIYIPRTLSNSVGFSNLSHHPRCHTI